MQAGVGTVQPILPFLLHWKKYLYNLENVKKHWEGQVDYRGFEQVAVQQAPWEETREVTYSREPMNEDLVRSLRNPFIRGSTAIQWSDMFVGEDGVTRAFEDFGEGEMIRHQHEGRTGVENSASAVVHDGCFFCFVCQKTYYVASTLPPDTYPFLPCEIHQRDEAGAFLPPPDSVDWSELLGRRFLAISSPMGTGKTTWLAYLCKVGACRDASVCVVTHRTLLALQIAQKCGLANYFDKLNRPLTTEEIERIGAWVLEDVR
jgi:hypothetical protein